MLETIALGGCAALCGVILVACGIGAIKDMRRRKIPCTFTDLITQSDFVEIAEHSAKKIKRLKSVSVDGPVINCTASSQDGWHMWNFSLDFNDYGHVTGNYWGYSESTHSQIPTMLGNTIKEEIARANTPCTFTDFITQPKFAEIAERSAKQVKRLKSVRVDGSAVYCTAYSEDRQFIWNFRLDFNDYGHVTGEYRTYSDSNYSSIPECLGNKIKEEIVRLNYNN